MVQIGKDLRERLKKPLGQVIPFSEALVYCKGRKVVCIGDEVTFNFLVEGKVPYVAVFDLKTLRHEVEPRVRGKLLEFYPNAKKVEKPAGDLSEEMFVLAKEYLEKGGALHVEGEEDLFALAFALQIDSEIVVYGQPGEGCVILEKGNPELEKLKIKVDELGLVLSD